MIRRAETSFHVFYVLVFYVKKLLVAQHIGALERRSGHHSSAVSVLVVVIRSGHPSSAVSVLVVVIRSGHPTSWNILFVV
jgi:hypothetical protein